MNRHGYFRIKSNYQILKVKMAKDHIKDVRDSTKENKVMLFQNVGKLNMLI